MELHELENQALHSINHFKKDEIYYLPLPSGTHPLIQIGGVRGIVKLRFFRKHETMFKSKYVQRNHQTRKWIVDFDILGPSNRPLHVTVQPNASIYIGNIISRFFTNYWHAYAYRLNAEASGWWL